MSSIQRQAVNGVYETIDEQLKSRFYNNPDVQRLLDIKREMVLDSRQSSFTAVADVLDFYYHQQ